VTSIGRTKPKLVIATNNQGKLREFERLLAGSGFDLVTPRDLGLDWEVEETGATFEENARLKAVDAARVTGLVALADDSGLEVDHLGGRPGIFSARYAGGSRTSATISEAEQLRLLLGEMDGVPDAQRTARFRCVIAIAAPAGDVRCVDGVFEGRIGYEPRGENGFGYDPIFVVPERGVTSAQLDPDEKNAMSHRGQAARKALGILKDMAGDDAAS
jgi:XTP/dITP diphosphohydrolase